MALEINQDLIFQQRQWRAQRVGWVVLALVLFAALLGLLGDGWLSHRRVSGGQVGLEYDYFLHRKKQTELHFSIPARSEQTEVEFDKAYLENFQVEAVTPEPSRTSLTATGYLYSFDGNGATPVFHLIPQRSGRVGGQIKVNGTPLDMRQFVYP